MAKNIAKVVATLLLLAAAVLAWAAWVPALGGVDGKMVVCADGERVASGDQCPTFLDGWLGRAPKH